MTISDNLDIIISDRAHGTSGFDEWLLRFHRKKIHIPEEISVLNLDRGEKEAISLSISKNALLLMDEERSREAARTIHIRVRGSLGVLIEAYRNNLISESRLKFHFEEIMIRNDIWISRDLCVRLLGELFGGG